MNPPGAALSAVPYLPGGIDYNLAGISVHSPAGLGLKRLVAGGLKRFYLAGNPSGPRLRLQLNPYDPARPSLPPLTPVEQGLYRQLGEIIPADWPASPLLQHRGLRLALAACLEHPSQAHLDLRGGRAILHDFHHGQVTYFYPRELGPFLSRVLLPAAYRDLLAPLLVSHSTLLLHAAGVVVDGKAVLFLAPSGGGKSTASSHAGERRVLSDDHIVLRRAGGRLLAYGTPFGRVPGSPGAAPLGALCLLEKAPRFKLIPAPANAAVQFVWNEHSHIWPVLTRTLRKQAFELLCDACAQAAVFRMQFTKEGVDWGAISAAMAAAGEEKHPLLWKQIGTEASPLLKG